MSSFLPLMIFSTARAVLSLLPPGAEPTTISTFLLGVHCCAPALGAAAHGGSPEKQGAQVQARSQKEALAAGVTWHGSVCPEGGCRHEANGQR